jgi:site-specific recombinase XerD
VRTLQDTLSGFRKVGPCLYRYRNGNYYARFKSGGKEIRCSLETTDRKLAERNLAKKKDDQSQIDRSQGKLTLVELCDRYLKTVQHQKPKTVERKTFIIGRIKSDWPTGKLAQVCKIKPSDVDLWLSRYRFGSASRNLHISCVKELFDSALRDRIITASPAAHLRSVKREKPIRLTPTFEQFNAIIADVRSRVFSADAQDSADFLEFLGLAGLGQAEAGSLTPADVDFASGQIITFRHKTSTGFAIPIFPQVRPLLERLCEGKAHDVRVFKISDAKKALAGACRRLGYPPFSQRSLRRMFIVRAIERGVDVKVIAEWQGHKDGGKLILDTYSHVNRAHSNRMAQLMSTEEPENIVPMRRADLVSNP